MPDRLLDDLAADAPAPRVGFTDDVVAAARRRVHRARAIVTGCVLTAAVAIAAPVAVQLGRSDPATPAAGGPTTSSTRGTGPQSSASEVPSRLGVYAAMIGHLQSASGNSVRAIEIRAATCTNVEHPSMTCAGRRPITAAQQRIVLRMVRSTHPIRFVAEPLTNPPGSTGPHGDVIFVTLGPARITGTRATEFVQSWCGFDCVRGDGYNLVQRDGTWRVTTSYGGYIS